MKAKDVYGFYIHINDEVVFSEDLYHNKFPESYWNPDRSFYTFKVKDIALSENGKICLSNSNDCMFIANCCILKEVFDFIKKILDSYYKFMV